MNPVAIILWLAGVAAIVVGWLRIRAPLARYRQLTESEANAARYDTWRGRPPIADAGPSAATEMARIMRQRAIAWGALIVAGIVLLLAGVAVR